MRYSRRYSLIIYIILILLVFIIPTAQVKADAGPKASLNFYFQSLSSKIQEGNLLICEDEICQNFHEYKNGLQCTTNYCEAVASPLDRFSEYYKIVITFSDGVRESNVFTKQGYNAQYEVYVEKDNLLVKEKLTLLGFFNPFLLIGFFVALNITATIEIGIAAIYTGLRKIKASFLWHILLVNILSLPILWFVLSKIETESEIIFLGIGESFVIIFETVFLIFAGRKFGIPAKHAILLSIVANLASFIVGWRIL